MYLFFIRGFNDIDHITPIAWKMSQTNLPVGVYCINPEYNIRSDYRLNFLKETGIKVVYIGDVFAQKLGWLHRMMHFLTVNSYAAKRWIERAPWLKATKADEILAKVTRKAGKFFYKLTRHLFYNRNLAQSFLEETGAKVVCFDWIRPHKYVVDVILKAAKELSIPTVALPHGVFIYTNENVQTIPKTKDQFERYNHFDFVVVQNRLFKDVILRSGVCEKKIFVLGSSRYSREWMLQHEKILVRSLKSKKDNNDKLKVIFMTTRPHYRVDVKRMLETYHMLSRLDGIEVMVKPHTRTGKESKIYESIPLDNVADISSVELCSWADVVLVIASSIIIEPLVHKKPALYLKYLHENITEYEEFGACWTIHDEAELRDALLSLQINKANVPYTEENTNNFLSEIIYGGSGERDVLWNYVDFISNSTVNKI